MPDVFLSYSRSGSGDQAQRIKEAFTARGIDVFLDTRSIAAGDEFPERIAESLLDATVVLVILDDRYFERTWCAYEFQVAVAPYRAAQPKGRTEEPLDHVALALAYRNDSVLAHLPPPLARQSWPSADDLEKIVDLVSARIKSVRGTLRERLVKCDEDLAVKRLRLGGSIPPPGNLAGKPFTGTRILQSLKDQFVGRSQELWRIFHILETGRVRNTANACAVVGTAGMGKSQLAAEYVWRYGPGHYPGGVIWIDADVDKRAVDRQLEDVLRLFCPEGPSPATDRDALDRALDQHVAAAAAKGRILWVVDNLPEPRPDRPTLPLKHWCPPINVVDLLCTSRRGKLCEPGLFHPESFVRLQELAAPAAIELLTQPPVSRRALKDDEWKIIVEWVGCLPLALLILRTSLAGFVEPNKVLARATGQEPAQALDDEVESLREDVAEEYLRGVAEALHDSYAALKGRPALRKSVHLLSWLAPTQTRHMLVHSWISHEQLAQLANRGWIDVGQGDEGHDVWRMHRVISSFLRTRSVAVIDELAELTKWLAQLMPHAAAELIPHADSLLSRLGDVDSAGDKSMASGVRSALFEIAVSNLADRAGDIARYDAASILARWGERETLLKELRNALDKASLATINGGIAMLPAIGGPGAAALCAELLCFPESPIQFAAMAIAEQLADDGNVADSLLDALIAATDEADPFDEYPDTPTTEGVVDNYLVQARSPNGSLQRLHWNHPFWQVIKAEPAREALIRLAQHSHSVRAAEHFAQQLKSAPSDELKSRAIVRLGFLLRAMSTPVPVKLFHVSTLNRTTGAIESRTEVRPPRFQGASAESYAALIEEAVSGSDQTSRLAVRVSYFSQFGMAALSNAVHDAVAAQSYAVAQRIAAGVTESFPDHINGLWWRGMARTGLGLYEEAFVDFGRVLGLQPKFFEARIERAKILVQRADYTGAQRELDLADRAQDAYTHLTRAYYYWACEAIEKAEDAAGCAIRLEPKNSAGWLARAQARYHLNKHAEATADAREARALGAHHQLIDLLLRPVN